MDLTALVPKDILDLLSAFLPNRRSDVARLRAAVAADDWAQLQHLAERLYALGNPYGFRQITTFGRLMREACAQRDKTALKRLIHAYAEYLSKVVVVEVDAPVTRLALSAESRSILVPDDGSGARNETVRHRRKHAVIEGTEAGASKRH